MITPEARRQLYAATTDDEIRPMLLQWTAAERVSLPEELPRRERVRALEEHFSSVKAPLISTLRAAGVTVKDLPASPQAIVQATPAQWRELLDQVEQLEHDPGIEILPNVVFHTLAGSD